MVFAREVEQLRIEILEQSEQWHFRAAVHRTENHFIKIYQTGPTKAWNLAVYDVHTLSLIHDSFIPQFTDADYFVGLHISEADEDRGELSIGYFDAGSEVGYEITVKNYDNYRAAYQCRRDGTGWHEGWHLGWDVNQTKYRYHSMNRRGSKTFFVSNFPTIPYGCKIVPGGEPITVIFFFVHLESGEQYVAVTKQDTTTGVSCFVANPDPKHGYPPYSQVYKDRDYRLRCSDNAGYMCTEDGYLWMLRFRDWQWLRLQRAFDTIPDGCIPFVACAKQYSLLISMVTDAELTVKTYLAHLDPPSLFDLAYDTIHARLDTATKDKLLLQNLGADGLLHL